MSQANADTVRKLLTAWNRGDIEGTLDQFDAECEVAFRPQVPEPGPFHGRAELRAWVEGFRGAWVSTHAELVEIVAETEDSLVAMLHLTSAGADSGIRIELTWPNLFEFRGGKIWRWRDFNERAEALAAARLSE
ncbi:MAG: nuclear transport factor 2 family protein [Actinomycetota bacterium]